MNTKGLPAQWQALASDMAKAILAWAKCDTDPRWKNLDHLLELCRESDAIDAELHDLAERIRAVPMDQLSDEPKTEPNVAPLDMDLGSLFGIEMEGAPTP